ncbi:MAG: tetratricopeptide repeat protein [Verrucomicrobiota bacterium]|jgi:tetratricopeptide (TPR) repeat protein
MITKPKAGFRDLRAGCLLLAVTFSLLRPALAADTNAAPETDGKPAGSGEVRAQDFLRSYLQIQEQLRDTQIAIEKIQQESAAASASNSVAVEERLRLMERAIASERADQLSGIEHLDRTVIVAAGAFAFVGFTGLLLAAFLQWSAVNRFAAAAASLPAVRSPQGLAMGPAEALLPPAHALEQSNMRFLQLMERMEQRLHDMEGSVTPPKTLPEGNSGNNPAQSSSEKTWPRPAPDKTDTIKVLLSKSQTLMKLDKPEAALDCLDKILKIDPDNAEALVKKGAALERLQRTEGAIECYDRAIAQDSTMIMAYLYKAGLLNRMERHSEALACYEQALKPGKSPME